MLVMDEEVIKKLNIFFNQYQVLKFKKGKTLYRPDDQILNIYLLKNGLIRQYIISEDGIESTINLFRPISFLPVMLVLSSQPNKYFFEAQTDVEVLEAPAEKVLEFLQKEPVVLFDLTRRFAAAIGGLATRVEELSFNKAINRLTSLLLFLADRFGQADGNKIIINLPLTHQDLASWASVSRETASRQLENLRKKGLIDYNKKIITILDKTRLQNL